MMLIVICGSVSDPGRLHSVARAWIISGHRVYVPTGNELLTKEEHDADHKRWLNSADAALIVHKPDGSLGESTTVELKFALSIGLPIYHAYYPETTDAGAA